MQSDFKKNNNIDYLNNLILKITKLNNFFSIIWNVGIIMIMIVITIPVGILLLIIGLFVSLFRFSKKKKANSIGNEIIKNLILENQIYDVVIINEIIFDFSFIQDRISFLIDNDIDFKNYNFDETKTRIFKGEKNNE